MCDAGLAQSSREGSDNDLPEARSRCRVLHWRISLVLRSLENYDNGMMTDIIFCGHGQKSEEAYAMNGPTLK